MAKRRELFRLAEVEFGLAATVGNDTGPVLLTDLQQGTLGTVVEYPRFREGLTEVPVVIWQDLELDEFAGRPRRRAKEGEFKLSAADFVDGERKKLRATTVAVFGRSESGIDADYAKHCRALRALKGEMTPADWETLILMCFKWQRDLVEGAADSLVPMVTASAFEKYLSRVKADYALDEGGGRANGTGGAKGGRPPVGHWSVIVSEGFRRLATSPTPLADGDVQEFAENLRTWAIQEIGQGKGVPEANTIAGRLRQVLSGGQFKFRLTDEPS